MSSTSIMPLPLTAPRPTKHLLANHTASAKMAGLFHAQKAEPPANHDIVIPGGTDAFEKSAGATACCDKKPVETVNAMSRFDHFKAGVKNLALVPLFPAIGYLGLDATGVGPYIASTSEPMRLILGEGFGHAGMCFSLHFVISAGYHLWKTVTG